MALRLVRSDVRRAADRLVAVRRAGSGLPRRRRGVSGGRAVTAGLTTAGLLATLAYGALRYQYRPEPGADVTARDTVGALRDALRPEALAPRVWDREALEPIIQEASALYDVDADLIRAVIQTESRFDHKAVSPVGAQGLMQLMPNTARSMGVKDPFDPRENILGGVKYLSRLLERYDGNTALALAGYNAGPTNVRRHRGLPPFRETQGYVRKIARLVAGSDAAFSIPAPKPRPKVRRAASRKPTRKKATLRSASVKRAALRGTKATAAKKARVSASRKSSATGRKASTRRTSRARRRT